MSNYVLRDAEVKYDYNVPTSGSLKEKYYQTLEFETSALPEIASWKVGEEYMIILRVREKRHELVKSEDKGVKERACFEVLEVGSFVDGTEEYRSKVKDKLK